MMSVDIDFVGRVVARHHPFGLYFAESMVNRRTKRLFDLIEKIYAAAVNGIQWSEALGAIADVTGSTHAALSVHDIRARAALFAASDGRDQAANREYGDYYHRINPWMNAGAALMHQGLVAPGEHLMPATI